MGRRRAARGWRRWLVTFDGWSEHSALCSAVGAALVSLPSDSWGLVARPTHWPQLPTDYVALEAAAGVEGQIRSLLLAKAERRGGLRVRGVWPSRWYSAPTPPLAQPPTPATCPHDPRAVRGARVAASASNHRKRVLAGKGDGKRLRARPDEVSRVVSRQKERVLLRAEGSERDVTGHGKAMPYNFISQVMDASSFWARGITGDGIRVAIFDTGVSPTIDYVREPPVGPCTT
eukprot:scaffold271879_cov30-Tisochrysis_lutea.AAC.1